MKIIITQSFRRSFEKQYKLHHFTILELVKAIFDGVKIPLGKNIVKIKLTIASVGLRGISVLVVGDVLVPLFVVLKSNKQWGRNLVLDKKVKKKVELLYPIYEQEIEQKKYELYTSDMFDS